MIRVFILIAIAMLSSAQAGRTQTAPGPAPPMAPMGPPHLALVNINTAMKHELGGLPGVGGREAEAIVRGRPYKHKDDLVRRKIIPRPVYEGLKDRIIAD